MIKISPKLLVAIYAVVPLVFIGVLIDLFAFDGYLRDRLPTDPNTFFWFTIIFTLPHILASFFSFFDRQYYQEYGSRLLRGAQIAVLAAVIIPLFNEELAFFVFAMFTMVHLFFQQSGVSKSLMQGSNRYHTAWHWCGAVAAGLLYIDVYTSLSLSNAFGMLAIGSLLVGFNVFGILAANASRTTIGTTYFWFTHLTLLTAAIFIALGYPILTVAVPRIIHDITAYAFYTVHDHNRFKDSRSNLLYKFFALFRVPVFIVSPVFSIGLAALLQSRAVYGAALPFISVVILMHYHTESYIWKRGSLHRRYINYLG